MINNYILEFILLNGVEAFLFMFMCLGFNWKSLAKGKLFLTWLLLTTIIYGIPLILFGIPVISNIIPILLSAFIISNLFDLKINDIIIKLCLLVFIVMLPCESIWYAWVKLFITIDIYSTMDSISRFVLGIGGRMAEFSIVFIYHKGWWHNMKMWFLGDVNKKKEEKKETEKK